MAVHGQHRLLVPAETEQPAYLADFLGPRPDSIRGARRWRQLAAGVANYREHYGITEQTRALGPEPKTADLAQRRRWRELRGQAERLWEQQRDLHERRGHQRQGPSTQLQRETKERVL